MTVAVANTELINSFGYLVNRVNELALASTTKYVSANSTTTVGNAAITGTFFANNIVLGNSTVNTSLTVTSFPGTANNSNNFNGQPPSYYANAQNINGSLQLTGQNLRNVSPTANPTGGGINNTYSTLVVQSNTVSSNNRQFAAMIGLYSNTGRSANGNNKDNVALYAAVEADGNTGDVWSLNSVVTVKAGANQQTIAYGYECDVNNMNSDRFTFDYPVYGIGVTGASAFKATTAFLVGGANGVNAPIWYRGLTFVANSISMNTIEDQTNSNTSFLITGTHNYGVDMVGGAFTNAAMRIAVGSPIKFNTDTILTYGDTANNVFLGRFGSVVVSGNNGSFLVNSTTPGGWAGSAASESVATASFAYGISAYYNNPSSNNGAAILARVNSVSGTFPNIARFFSNTSLVGTISIDSSSVSYNTTSDYRLKQNITPIANSGGLLDSLEIYEFNYANNPLRQFGGLAHEIQEVVPSAVTGFKDALNADGTINPQMVDYSKIVPLLIQALKDTRRELDALKLRVEDLEEF